MLRIPPRFLERRFPLSLPCMAPCLGPPSKGGPTGSKISRQAHEHHQSPLPLSSRTLFATLTTSPGLWDLAPQLRTCKKKCVQVSVSVALCSCKCREARQGATDADDLLCSRFSTCCRAAEVSEHQNPFTWTWTSEAGGRLLMPWRVAESLEPATLAAQGGDGVCDVGRDDQAAQV